MKEKKRQEEKRSIIEMTREQLIKEGYAKK